VAIVSDKPQTTRTRVVGVRTYDTRGQIVFVDTPGVHKPTHRLNVRMVDAAREAMREVDLLALIVDASVKSGPGDRYLLEMVKQAATPALLVLNKVDLVAKQRLLPLLDEYRQAHAFLEFVPVSAVDGTNVDVLERLFLEHLPEGEPFSTAVVVDKFEEPDDNGLMNVYCTILVERDSQKSIVVGKSGSMIKAIGTAARLELEKFFACRLYLDLHVKVKSEWRNDERVLDDLGVRGRTRS
jgi:GTP-binding protein Era